MGVWNKEERRWRQNPHVSAASWKERYKCVEKGGRETARACRVYPSFCPRSKSQEKGKVLPVLSLQLTKTSAQKPGAGQSGREDRREEEV